LIPAITEVGNLYDKQIYFLPQLITGAEAMKTAIDYLEPLLKRDESNREQITIVIATVAGDIHDIGKNLVTLMLKNYGFRVIDLGKDVPTEKIIQTAKEEDADFIALSALMTTTMVEMARVVELAKSHKLRAQIIIGGAVVTDSYREEIGADGYSEDAQSAVALVKRLTKKL
jgi:5-methyltetrahydrofolate--homocysteine methyltransferase